MASNSHVGDSVSNPMRFHFNFLLPFASPFSAPLAVCKPRIALRWSGFSRSTLSSRQLRSSILVSVWKSSNGWAKSCIAELCMSTYTLLITPSSCSCFMNLGASKSASCAMASRIRALINCSEFAQRAWSAEVIFSTREGRNCGWVSTAGLRRWKPVTPD